MLCNTYFFAADNVTYTVLYISHRLYKMNLTQYVCWTLSSPFIMIILLLTIIATVKNTICYDFEELIMNNSDEYVRLRLN